MYEDHRPVLRKDYIWLAGEILAVQTKPIAERMERCADTNLRRGVFAAYRGHISAALLTCVNIGHRPALATSGS